MWWHVLVALLDLYLIVSLGPWIALQILEWVLQKSGPFLATETKRLDRLGQAERDQVSLWPPQPRPGQYKRPDRLAREALAELRTSVNEASRLLPALGTYAPQRLSFLQVACLCSWGPLLKAMVTWRDVRALRGLLDQGDEALATLFEQHEVVQGIPGRGRALLNETRAEIRRLGALLEAEEDAGTFGLRGTTLLLETAQAQLEGALDRLVEAEAQEDQLPLVAQEIDAVLDQVGPTVAEANRLLGQASGARIKAQNSVEFLNSSLSLLEERWEGLKARGATEPSVSRALASLRIEASRLVQVVDQRSVRAYRQVAEDISAISAQAESLGTALDHLGESISRSREATAGCAQALAEAQAATDEMTRQDPLIDPDLSLSLIEKATEAHVEAGRHHGLGTTEGYGASIALSKTANEDLSQAVGAADLLPGRVRQVRALLPVLAPETLSDWRNRANRVREQLRTYSRHWDADLASDAAEAISNLDQVEVDLERIPPDVRYERRFRQSELDEAIEILSHADGCMAGAKELTTTLEQEEQRIESLRGSMETALGELNQQTWPAVLQLRERMLPELQERLETLRASFAEDVSRFADPTQINYNEATGEWLPTILRQLAEIRAAHENDVRHYRTALRETTRRLKRQWARLSRLAPRQQPGPEESIDKLAADLDDWQAEADRNADSPLALRELAGRRARALERRTGAAHDQIREGRRRLDALAKEYHKRARTVQGLRSRMRDVQRQSQWPLLSWDVEEAEQAWERASARERESRSAATLMEASNQLQEAVNAAREAEQIHVRIEHQMRSALRRLNEGLRAVTSALERRQRRADRLREEGPTATQDVSETLATLEQVCASATRVLGMARDSTTFEDALRHLQEARNVLSRL